MASLVEPAADHHLGGCPACGSDDGASTMHSLHRCGTCDHVWVPLAEVDNRIFESEDYASWRTSSEAQLRRQRAIAEERISWISDLLPDRGRSLEIGCSTGEVVAALAARSWSAHGIDLSAHAIRSGAERHPGARLAVGSEPGGAGFPEDGYDLICAFHVVEHLADLETFAAMVDRGLQRGGLLYLRMPNWDSWSRRALGHRWPSLVPEHVHHFSPSSVSRWLEARGLVVVRLGTKGDAREWAGGVRRVVKGGPRGQIYETVGSNGVRLLHALQRAGRPWFWIEERCRRGSELAVVARKP